MVGWIGRALSQVTGSVGVSRARSNERVARDLHREAERLRSASPVQHTEAFDYAMELAFEISKRLGLPSSLDLLRALTDCIEHLAISNAVLAPHIEWSGVDHEGAEGRELRRYLERHRRFHENSAINERRFRDGLRTLFAALLVDLPIR